MSKNRYDDSYDSYADLFDPMTNDRQARRKRKPKVRHMPKKSQAAIIEEIADVTGVEAGELDITYKPSLYEAGWLVDSLRTFFIQGLITDVLSLVKGGKEANVYCCAAHPSTGVAYLAAKVYRPRQFRSLSNDAMYREGRDMIGGDGKKIRERDRRAIRAVEQKTTYGALVSHTSWLMYEHNTLDKLWDLGVSVPRPFGNSDNALLLEYIGETPHTAAPTLNHVRLDAAETRPLFAEVLAAIEIMLANGIVHGDLSAYNMLYLDGTITLIDFPQVIDPQVNSNAYAILKRDIQRVCDYFAAGGVDCDARAIMADLWSRYLAVDPEDRAADLSRFEEADDDEDE